MIVARALEVVVLDQSWEWHSENLMSEEMRVINGQILITPSQCLANGIL